jgi:hypothetical protein
MAKKGTKRFTESDFKRADRLEKIYMTIQQPNDFDLTDTDERYKRLLQQAYPIIISGRPQFEVMRLIMTLEGGLWRSQVSQIIRDTQELYAAFDSVHPKILRGVMREMLLENVQVLKKIRDDDEEESSTRIKAADSITKAVDNMSKYAQLDKKEEESEDFEPMGDMDFSNEIEEAEYNEIQNTLKTENSLHVETDSEGVSDVGEDSEE